MVEVELVEVPVVEVVVDVDVDVVVVVTPAASIGKSSRTPLLDPYVELPRNAG